MNQLLYLITNRKLIKNGDLYSVVKKVILGGVDVVILREKDLSYDEIYETAYKLKKITDSYNIPLIINNDLAVAKKLKAYGFHTGINGLNEDVNNYSEILGISVHSLEEAKVAEKFNPDYLLASHIYETDCKKGLVPKGSKLIEEIKNNINIPIIGLGGINHENLEEVLSYGVKGVAVMSYIMASENPYESAKRLKDIIVNYNNKGYY